MSDDSVQEHYLFLDRIRKRYTDRDGKKLGPDNINLDLKKGDWAESSVQPDLVNRRFSRLLPAWKLQISAMSISMGTRSQGGQRTGERPSWFGRRIPCLKI